MLSTWLLLGLLILTETSSFAFENCLAHSGERSFRIAESVQRNLRPTHEPRWRCDVRIQPRPAVAKDREREVENTRRWESSVVITLRAKDVCCTSSEVCSGCRTAPEEVLVVSLFYSYVQVVVHLRRFTASAPHIFHMFDILWRTLSRLPPAAFSMIQSQA